VALIYKMMKFFNTEFSKQGFEDFQKLTRKQQVDYLKEKNPLTLESVIESKLKAVKHAKPKRNTKATSKSNRKQTSKES
jgi:hypothetical protein